MPKIKNMKKIYFIVLLFFVPGIAYGSTASDFKINNQSVYAVPADTTKLLILDLTLPDIGLTSIKIHNAGTAQQYNISKISIYEDGPSPGWDGDELEKTKKSLSPFWDTELSGDFFQQRIFVTVDITSTTQSGTTIKPELAINSALFSNPALSGPSDQQITGLERTILTGANIPTAPFAPIAQNGEALTTSVIRWHFTDLSDNEFGFKILDGNLKEVARTEQANLAYLDETGLQPDTEYAGRRIVAFNDRGENSVSASSVFPAKKTLAAVKVVENIEPVIAVTTTNATATTEEAAPAPTLFETIQTKIADLQRQINDFIKQLDEFIKQSSAAVVGALQGFLQALF